jgi:hypothetical protein
VGALASVGLKVEPTKSIIYPPSTSASAAAATAAAAPASASSAANDTGQPAPTLLAHAAQQRKLPVVAEGSGFILAGVPFGPASFQREHVKETVDQLERQLKRLETAVSIDHKQRSLQCIYHIIRFCVPPQLNYLLRTLPPDITVNEAVRADNLIEDTIFRLIGHDSGDLAEARTAMARRILHLPQRLGGGGIGSIAVSQQVAYVSSWALVGNEITNHIPNLHEQLQHIQCLQHTFQRLKDTALHSELADQTVSNIFHEPYAKLQHCLLENLHNKESTDIKSSLVGEERANFVSASTREAGAWITASPYHAGCQMSNIDFSTALKLRLHLPVLAEQRRCTYCKQHASTDGYHAFHCTKNPALNGSRSIRHTAVKDAIVNITQNLRSLEFRARAEQSMANAGFVRKDGKSDDNRMDVALIDNREGPAAIYIIDVNVATVHAGGTTPYATAKKGEQEKISHYTKHWVIPSADRFLVPWVIEVPGAWGPKARTFAKWLSEQVHDRGGGLSAPAFYRLLVERVAVALQSSVASSVRALARHSEPVAP